MEQIGDLKLYTLEEVEDVAIGPVGTPRRDDFERRLKEELANVNVPKPSRRNPTVKRRSLPRRVCGLVRL